MPGYRREPITTPELESLFLFQDIEPAGLISLLAHCPIVCLGKNEVLIAQGAANRNCYFILSGSLRIHLDSLDHQAVSTLATGESVGEISLLDGQPASAHVVCPAECQALVVDEELFWSLVNSFHLFCRNLLFLMIRRLRGSNVSISESFRRQREYQLTSTIDELTGLYNRRWLREMLPRQMRRSQGEATPLTLLLIDGDHFKQVNDVHGHNAGDQVLRSLARSMTGSVRPTDLVARYGGEEFIIVLPETGLAEARLVAGRMRERIAEAKRRAAAPAVTVSIGLAQMTADETMEELIARADAALYRAKENGRDRVEE